MLISKLNFPFKVKHAHLVLCLILILFSKINIQAQRLSGFESATNFLLKNNVKRYTSYTDLKTYYGYYEDTLANSKPAEKKFEQHIYFSLSKDVNELGLRIISPVPTNTSPGKGDVVSDRYTIHENEKLNYFDPFLKLYWADDNQVTDANYRNGENISWLLIAENDNNNELEYQPSGNKNNALIRRYDTKNNQAKICKAGLYKIVISNSDTVNKTGSYFLQVGCNEEIPAIKLSEKLERVINQ